MFKTTNTLVKATCLSLALLGSTAVVATMVAPDVAFAKSDKAKGKGGNSDKAKGKDKSKSKAKNKSSDRTSATREDGGKVFNGKGNRVIQELAAAGYHYHPSDLGSLNAWNNNSDNTNPNSVVGQLNLFKAEVAESIEMKAELDAANLLLETLVVEDDTYALYDADGNLLGYDVETAAADLAAMTITQEEYDAMLAYELQRALNADLEDAYQENLEMEATYFEQAANGNFTEDLLNAFRAMLGAES